MDKIKTLARWIIRKIKNGGLMTETGAQNIEIRPNKCFRLFEQSFNRVKYFSCIADNIGIDNFPNEWGIQNKAGITYGINVPPENKKTELLDGLKYFLQRYLVRDCLESFALCLDKLCFVLLLCSEGKREIKKGQSLYDTLNDEEKSFLEKFSSRGVSPRDGKVGLLKEKFALELSDDSKKIIRSLKDIRDCLTHRNGVVSDRDGDAAKGGKRKFHWIAMDVFIIDSKTKTELPFEIGKTYNLEEGGDLCIKFKESTKLLNVGAPLSFTAAEAYEIASSLQNVAREYLEKIHKKFAAQTKHA